jgi:hypothetical protein
MNCEGAPLDVGLVKEEGICVKTEAKTVSSQWQDRRFGTARKGSRAEPAPRNDLRR